MCLFALLWKCFIDYILAEMGAAHDCVIAEYIANTYAIHLLQSYEQSVDAAFKQSESTWVASYLYDSPFVIVVVYCRSQ